MAARITINPTVAGTVLLAASLLVATPALADDADLEGCCICDCDKRATTSGVPALPLDALCIDGAATVCSELCALEGCSDINFAPTECSAIPGCPQSAGVMAPAASPLLLTGIAAALVTVGIAAVRRGGRRNNPTV